MGTLDGANGVGTAVVARKGAMGREAPPEAMRVLVLTASYGSGHQSCATALAECWERDFAGVHVDLQDYYRAFASRLLARASTFAYAQSIKRAPLLYGSFYRLTESIRWDHRLQRNLNRVGQEPLARYVAAQPADVVVSLHPGPAGACSGLRLAGRLPAAAATVITDYAIHSQWIHPGTDLYLVGCERVADGLLARGVEPERIRITGIPVRRRFVNDGVLPDCRVRYGVPADRPVFLIMPGAYGAMAGTREVMRLLADLPVHVVTVCGHDRRLKARLEREGCPSGACTVLGWSDAVHELMGIADLIITKAGGITVTEAVTKEVPILVYRSIPGQEEQNTEYLADLGVAVHARDHGELRTWLRRFATEPALLAEMRARARAARRPEAACDAARAIIELATTPVEAAARTFIH